MKLFSSTWIPRINPEKGAKFDYDQIKEENVIRN